MAKAMKARHGGFTLVELLIVIIIIAILAGMLLLATGSATDNAEATKIINDLRNVKAAAMMYYVDNDAWPINSQIGTIEPSIDMYLDRPMFDPASAADPYSLEINDSVMVGNQERALIGFTTPKDVTVGVQNKLAGKAIASGVVQDAAGAPAWLAGTTAAPITVMMMMR